MTPRPVNIAASRSRGMLLIDWDDSHHSAYPLAGLRAVCPCAECRGGHENMGLPGSPDMLQRPLSPSQSGELESLEIVGSYALQPIWKDGHRYGLYTWGLLRQLCPCGEHDDEMRT
jgi:DUF971 family protein